MGDWLWTWFDELRQTFRVADAFDIALISLLIYAILVWFQTTASRSLAIGVSVLAALYFAARVIDLYLTSLVFQGAFAVLLVVLVVVFQEDLRRMLERLASWGSLSKLRSPVNVHPEIDLLVESVFHLAETKTGVLIVDERAPTEARITLSGLERGFRFFDPASLKVAIDMGGLRAASLEIPVTDKEVRLPANLKIYRIEPRTLDVTLREQREPTEPAAVEPSQQPRGKGDSEP